MRITVLGCGGSGGTPTIDRGWGNCDPNNPRNRRRRPSVLVEEGKTRILIDTSPDLREQLISADVRELDAVVFTHAHADHLHGIDDLRPVNKAIARPLDIHADTATLAAIRHRFGYVLEPLAEGANVYYKPVLIPHEITPGRAFRIGPVEAVALRQDHGFCDTLGYRFGNFAYSSDAVELSEEAFGILDGVDVWIVGAFTDRAHPTHAHVDKAIDWIQRVKPRQAYLTHLSAELDYGALAKRLPAGIAPAHDGLVIEIPNPA